MMSFAFIVLSLPPASLKSARAPALPIGLGIEARHSGEVPPGGGAPMVD
jgi:hypothetical protein